MQGFRRTPPVIYTSSSWDDNLQNYVISYNRLSEDAKISVDVMYHLEDYHLSLSTDEYSCKFDVTYEGDNYRDVNCISGCSLEAEPAEDSENKENEEFCNQYRYSAIEAGKRGNLLNRMLDDEYLNRMNIVNRGGSGGD